MALLRERKKPPTRFCHAFFSEKPARVLEGKARARLTVKNNNRGYLSRVDFARKFADFGGLFASVYGRFFFSVARVPPTTNRSREIATKNFTKKSNWRVLF